MRRAIAKEGSCKCSNSWINDTRLTDSALRVLLYMVRNVDTWKFNTQVARKTLGFGQEKMNNALHCLRRLGYAVYYKPVNPDTGRYEPYYEFFEDPEEGIQELLKNPIAQPDGIKFKVRTPSNNNSPFIQKLLSQYSTNNTRIGFPNYINNNNDNIRNNYTNYLSISAQDGANTNNQISNDIVEDNDLVENDDIPFDSEDFSKSNSDNNNELDGISENNSVEKPLHIGAPEPCANAKCDYPGVHITELPDDKLKSLMRESKKSRDNIGYSTYRELQKKYNLKHWVTWRTPMECYVELCKRKYAKVKETMRALVCTNDLSYAGADISIITKRPARYY